MSNIKMNNDEFRQSNWNDKLTELKKFIDLNGRRPSNKKETEKVLGLWLSCQLNNIKTEKNIMNNECIRNTWNSFIKDYQKYFLSNEELWTDNLIKLKMFIDLNKRKPLQKKETEKSMGQWLSDQLKNRKTEKYNMLNGDIRNTWDNFIKDYEQYFLSNEELWINNLTELKAFIDLNKRRPIKERDTETVLCVWLYAQLKNRKTEKYNMINEDIRNSWDNFIKDYNQYFLSNEELWTNNLTELKIFIDLNKRRPIRGREIEKVLSIWLGNQLKNRKTKTKNMLNEDIRNTWNSFIKDYQVYFN